MKTTPDVQILRADTPGCAEKIHLNNAGASLQPRPVLDAVAQHLELETQLGGYEAGDAREAQIRQAYASIAGLVGARPDQIAFAASATDAYARALSSIHWNSGDVLLTTENDYVSNQIAFLALKRRFGIELVRAKGDDGTGVDHDDFEKQLKTRRPKLVAVTHVPTNSGLVQPVATLGQLVKQHSDAFYLVDACQSAGQMPLDVHTIGCDFLSATFRKFLRGPRGTGFLYVSDRVLKSDMEMMLPDMRSALWTGVDSYEPVADARRFEYWEMPVALQLGAGVAAEYAMHLGLDWIKDRTSTLAAALRGMLREIPGVRVLDVGEKLSGIVTLHHDRWQPQGITQWLGENNINGRISTKTVAQIDFGHKGVAWALRLSPHYYNTEAEIRQTVEVLRQAK
ncbi:MAG: aminotransferase class V-fold PLP-dependent enzyme [Saprospiraceae bacterium]|nr:aminotransferase class V-fold PLP-dependent enzyme [Saprospiraceae bacterium]